MTRPCFLVNQDLKGLKKKNYKINIFYFKKKKIEEKRNYNIMIIVAKIVKPTK